MKKIKRAAGLAVINGLLNSVLLGAVSTAAYAEDVVRVTLTTLGDVAQPMRQSVPATVVSLNDVTLSTEITASVVAIQADVGDQVKQGDVLAELDCRDYQAALKQARAGLEGTRAQQGAAQARADAAQARMVSAKARIASGKAQADLAQAQWRRASDLLKRKMVSRDAFDQAQAGYNTANSTYQAAQTDLNAAQADWVAAKADVVAIEAGVPSNEAQIETARLATARCQVIAPFAGQITQRSLQHGQLATPGTPAFQLLETRQPEISAQLSVSEVADQLAGSTTQFLTHGQTVSVQRRAVIGRVAGNSRTQEVRFKAEDAASRLLIGSNGRVTWQGKLPALPADWLVQRGGVLGVMLAVEGKAKFHAFPEAREGQAVLTDLPATTSLIDANRLRVRDGQAITVEPVGDNAMRDAAVVDNNAGDA